MAYGQVTKIYELRSLGYGELVKQLRDIDKAFDDIKAAKKAAEKGGDNAQTTEEARKYREEVERLKVVLQQLKVEQQQANNDAKAAQYIYQAEQRAKKQTIDGNNAEIGSIKALRNEISELNKAIINRTQGGDVAFRGQTMGYEAAKQKLKQLMSAEQDWRRQFAKDNLLVGEYTSGIVQAFKKMGLSDLIGGQITKAQDRLKDLNKDFEELKKELSSIHVNGEGGLENVEKKLIENRQEAGELEKKLQGLKKEFRGTGDVGNQITSSISEGFKNMKGQLAQFVLSYVGFQAMISGAQKLIHENYELSDSIANLQMYLKGSKQDADNLVESLKKIDTRTSLANLVDMASIVAKKGIAKDQITGITQAIDNLMLTLGKDIGDPHEAVASLVKLVTVYSEDKHVTAENIDRIGGAIAKLTQSGVATGHFLIEFTEAMAGIRGVTHISISDVLGLGAGLEELAQKASVSSSALSQVVVKMFTNSEKVAQSIGMSTDAFKEMLKNNPLESLITVAQKLVGNGDMAAMDDFFGSMKEFGRQGKGIVGVLGDIGANADYARKRMADAKAAMEQTGIAANAAAIKQNNFAATIDKIKKQFELLGANPKFLKLLSAIGDSLLFLIKTITAIPFGVWVTGIGLASAAYLYLTGNQIKSTLAQSWNNKETLLGATRLLALRLGLISTTVATEAQTVATEGATVAQTGLNTAMKASPLGIILAIIGVLIPVMSAFADSTDKVSVKIKALGDETKRMNAIKEETAKAISEEISKTIEQKNRVSELIEIIKDENSNQDLRKRAYEELIKINNDFIGTVDAEYKATDGLNKVYDDYIQKLDQVARAKAYQSVREKRYQAQAEASEKVFEKAQEYQKNKDEYKKEKEKPVTYVVSQSSAGAFSYSAQEDLNSKAKNKMDRSKEERDEAEKEFEAEKQKNSDYTKYIKTRAQEYENANKKLKEQLKTAGEKSKKEIQKQIDFNNNEIAALLGSTPEITTPSTSVVNKGGGSSKSGDKDKYKSSGLTDQQKDKLKDIDATRDEELATLKEMRALDLIDEETYLQTSLQTNQEAIAKKLNFLKGANAEERKQIAELNVDRITKEEETTQKIFELRKKTLDNSRLVAQSKVEDTRDNVLDNQNVSEHDKAQAKLNADNELLAIDTKYLEELKVLTEKYNQDTIKLQEETNKKIKELTRQLREDNKKLLDADIADIEKKYNSAKASAKNSKGVLFNEARKDILKSNKSQKKKDALLAEVDKQESISNLNIEIKMLEEELPVYKKKLDEKYITYKEYTDKEAELTEKYIKLKKSVLTAEQQQIKDSLFGNIKDIPSAAKAGVAKLFNNVFVPKEGDTPEETKQKENNSAALGIAIAEGYNTAQVAMNNYFDAEHQRIENSLKQQQKVLEQQQRVAEGRAQSAAEAATIERQYAEKKQEAEKAAFEKNKKMQLEQAKINLATELGGIWASVWQLGTITGAILGAVLTGFAILRYSSNVSKIRSATYEYGGNPDTTTTRGGKVKGQSHANGGNPFMFKGRVFEDEVDELNVIRTKDASPTKQYTISGTHTQIASKLNELGGGIQFASGATYTTGSQFAYGGGLGEVLQAPMYTPAEYTATTINNSSENEAMKALILESRDIAIAANKRMDRMEVVQVTSTVTTAQKKQVIQSSIGRL